MSILSFILKKNAKIFFEKSNLNSHGISFYFNAFCINLYSVYMLKSYLCVCYEQHFIFISKVLWYATIFSSF